MNQFQILLFLLIITGCKPVGLAEDYIGIYQEEKKSNDFTKLHLEEQNFYHLVQDENYSDIPVISYGKWDLVGRNIILKESKNLSEIVSISSLDGISKDTSTIQFSKSLKNTIGEYKVSINIDTVSEWSTPDIIVLDKNQSYDNFRKNIPNQNDKTRFYRSYPVNLIVRNKDYLIKLDYIFTKNQITIDLDSTKISNESNNILKCKLLSGNRLKINGNKNFVSTILIKT